MPNTSSSLNNVQFIHTYTLIVFFFVILSPTAPLIIRVVHFGAYPSFINTDMGQTSCGNGVVHTHITLTTV